MIHLDTTVLVLAHGGKRDRIPVPVRHRIDTDDVVLSPVIELELAFLHEVGRLTSPPTVVLDHAISRWGSIYSAASLTAVMRTARDLSWTRDPFDRLITANAIADDADLATRDRTIRANFEGAIWDR